MSIPSLHTHLFVVCRSIAWDGFAGPNTSRTLESVAYTYRTELPDGFPYETDFWLFFRLAHAGRRAFHRTLRVSLIWLDDPDERAEVWNRKIQTVTFRPEVPVRDMATQISGIFEGAGRYEFRLWYNSKSRWDQSQRRRIIARTYIRIEE